MPTQPKPPDAAVVAAAYCIYEHTVHPMRRCRDLADAVIASALPHLLPGMYVKRAPGYAAIMSEASDGRGPEELLRYTRETEDLFKAIAALLPDRTNDSEG